MSGSDAPTSRDVARAAGVSQTTVSYALTGRGNISAATRARVLEVAESIGYRPNLAARSMRTRRSGRVAVIMGSAVDTHMRLLAGAIDVAGEAGFVAETLHADGSPQDRIDRIRELASGGQYEGILTIAPLAAGAIASDSSCVVVSAATFDDELRSVGALADATQVATLIETLAAAGHRRFLHVAGAEQYASARARRSTYVETIERLGLESLGVVGGSWSPEAGRTALLALPDDAGPVAVIAANDHVAIGVMRGAAERGWAVPGDLVVTGWDNNGFGAYTSPSLTSVDVDFREAGRRAMRTLLMAMGRPQSPQETGSLHRIVWRESTGRVSATD